jgi:cell division transport system permease protein
MRRRIIQALADGTVNLGRAWRSTSLALAAIVSAVFVLGAFLLLSRAVDDAVSRWGEAAELSVFLREDASERDRSALEAALRADPAVQDVRAVSSREAAERFARSFPDLASLVAAADASRLPASLEARLGRGADVTGVMALAGRLRQMPGVADVRVDQELLAGLLSVARAGRLVGGGLAALLVLAAALAIGSVVRLSYVARRDEIDVLYLLGAPLSAIRAPFVAEGALQGALGTTFAIGLLALAHAVVVRRYGETLADFPVAFLPVWLILALVSGGVAVGAAAGYAAVRAERHDVMA